MIHTKNLWFIILSIFCIITGCTDNSVVSIPTEFGIIPTHLSNVPIPSDNPITKSKVELGRMLFFEKRLSKTGTISCASCHRPEKWFSDSPNQVSRGINSSLGQRNTPTLINVAYRQQLNWDGQSTSLEEQIKNVFLSSTEMKTDTIAVGSLMRSLAYRDKWVESFGDTTVTMKRVIMAIASFERTLVSANSRYDRYILGETDILTESERRGMNLFFSSKTMCSSCHNGQDFTDNKFHNIGLFSHYFDRGRYNITKNPNDDGLFRTPTLRNIEFTPPYMSSGDSQKGPMNTLEQVVQHYNEGGFPFPNRDKRIKKLGLTDDEVSDIVAFMKTLSDSSILHRSEWLVP